MNIAYNSTSKAACETGTDEELETGMTFHWFQRSGLRSHIHITQHDVGSCTLHWPLQNQQNF